MNQHLRSLTLSELSRPHAQCPFHVSVPDEIAVAAVGQEDRRETRDGERKAPSARRRPVKTRVNEATGGLLGPFNAFLRRKLRAKGV